VGTVGLLNLGTCKGNRATLAINAGQQLQIAPLQLQKGEYLAVLPIFLLEHEGQFEYFGVKGDGAVDIGDLHGDVV
jgi:uncharacterized lipoprotein NlpE involved in copper resistance